MRTRWFDERLNSQGKAAGASAGPLPSAARIPSGDRRTYPFGEGSSVYGKRSKAAGESAGPLPSAARIPSGDRRTYPFGEGLT